MLRELFVKDMANPLKRQLQAVNERIGLSESWGLKRTLSCRRGSHACPFRAIDQPSFDRSVRGAFNHQRRVQGRKQKRQKLPGNEYEGKRVLSELPISRRSIESKRSRGFRDSKKVAGIGGEAKGLDWKRLRRQPGLSFGMFLWTTPAYFSVRHVKMEGLDSTITACTSRIPLYFLATEFQLYNRILRHLAVPSGAPGTTATKGIPIIQQNFTSSSGATELQGHRCRKSTGIPVEGVYHKTY
jgi:hypothetical protein